VPIAQRVCAQARQAAASTLHGTVKLRIASSDPTNLECVLSTAKARIDVNAQASPQAWTQYDTTVVHQAQVFGSGTVHSSAKLPRDMPGIGTNAAWIPAKDQLVATNGSQSHGGSYMTVTLTHARGSEQARVRLARAVAVATLAIAPRGSNPGPPPS
jgi:hypothetical protein